MSEESPRLRNAEAIYTLGRGYRARLVFYARDQVPDRRKPQPYHWRILGPVYYFINLSRLEPVLERNVSRVGNRLSLDHPGKLPVVARNQPPLAKYSVTDGKLVVAVCWIYSGLRVLSAMSKRRCV